MTLIEHWDGTAWQIVDSPNVANATADGLNSVTRVPGTRTLWAVGSDDLGMGGPFMEYWDGSTWSIVPNSIPRPQGGSGLSSIIAISANNVWAVGDISGGTIPPTINTLTAHWDGTSWNVVPSPNGGTGENTFASVAQVPHTGKLWAVGNYLLPGGATSQALIASYSPQRR
jgi:hypothetical protein